MKHLLLVLTFQELAKVVYYFEVTIKYSTDLKEYLLTINKIKSMQGRRLRMFFKYIA